jgi:hypothetical protein
MSESEWGDRVECAACGVTIALGVEPTYVITEDRFLCLTCGLTRGGAYDPKEDRWTREPDVEDIIGLPPAHP